MRTITSTLQTAIETDGSFQISARVVIEKARIYFYDYDDNFSGTGHGFDAGVPEAPWPQDHAFSSYDNRMILFLTYSDGVIYTNWENSITWTSSGITTSKENKPAISSNYMFYLDTSGNLNQVSWTTPTEGTVSFGTPTTIEATLGIYGSLHALSDTEVVAMMLDEGGIRATYFRYGKLGWGSFPAEYRFMDQTAVIEDEYRTVFTAAARTDDGVYVYCSMADGTVRGCKLPIGIWKWGDIFTAVYADLSEFWISNALVSNDRIHLCGQFVRTEELDTGVTYNFVLESTTGETFAIDRTSLVSRTGIRWLLHQNAQYVIFANTGRYAKVEPSLFFTSVPESLEIPGDDLIGINLTNSESGQATGSMEIKSGDEFYNDNDLIIRNNLAKVYLGYSTSSEYQEILWGVYVIDEIAKEYLDGDRRMNISLVSDGMWRVERIPSPIYAEIVGHSMVYDDVDKLDNFYVAPGAGNTADTISIDFWESEAYEQLPTVTGVSIVDPDNDLGILPYEAAGSHSVGIKSKDLKAKFAAAEYPITRELLTVSIYGWSRTTATGDDNDTLYPILIYEDEEGEEHETGPDAMVSTYPRWPQQYYDTVAGSNPVIFSFNTTRGWKIKSVALTFTSDNTTVFMPSRVELVGAAFTLDGALGNDPWKEVDGGLETPGIGRPYVMFSVRPYSTFDFCINGSFAVTIGEVANTQSTYFGLIGLASDGANYIAARYDWQNTKVEIVKVRDNAITVLASVTYDIMAADMTAEMMFIHQGGKFSVLPRISGAWIPSVLDYEWLATDGPMSMSENDIMHVGILGYVNTPSFLANAFDADGSYGIGVSPVSDLEELDYFPTSGRVVIGDCIYSYDGKSDYSITDPLFSVDTVLGPYPAIDISDADVDMGADIYYFYWDGSSVARSNYVGKGFVMALDDKCVLLGEDCTYSSKCFADNYSRWYSNHIDIYTSIDSSTKCFIGRGLTDTALVKGDEIMHSEFERCSLYTTEKIKITKFSGNNISNTVTIKDMIGRVCGMVGATPQFSGDRSLSIQLTSDGTAV